MLRFKRLFLIQLLLLFGMFSTTEAIKPRPPLQLALLQAALSEEESQLTLMATANIDAGQVKLAIDLPPGLSLIKGEAAWEGPLKEGESQKIEIVVQSRDQTPQKIVGKATVELNQGETFVQQSTLLLNRPKPENSSPGPSVRRKEGGESILEFKGK